MSACYDWPKMFNESEDLQCKDAVSFSILLRSLAMAYVRTCQVKMILNYRTTSLLKAKVLPTITQGFD